MKKIIITSFILGTFILSSSCNKDKAAEGFISVNLTDAPGNYQKVNVDIQAVEVHVVPTSGSSQWVSLPTKSGIYDLLVLQNGIDTSLVNTTALPSGKITQMRLILGANNSVVDNSNVSYVLTVPSGSKTGIKIPGPIVINPNATLNVILDFDADQSVIQQGNQDYQLKPVIKVL